MEKLLVKYKIIKYDDSFDENILDSLEEMVVAKEKFNVMVEKLIKKNNIDYFSFWVENLLEKTWGKYFSDKQLRNFCSDSFHLGWANYEIGEMQKMFKLFDNTITIIVDGPGIGGTIHKEEGISFKFNPGEKDRHANEPHVHCEYNEEKMRIRIDTLEIMKKDEEFSNAKKVKIAKKWIKDNQKELLKCYEDFSVNGINNLEACFDF